MIQDYKISKKAYKKSLKYIQARMNGNNKKEKKKELEKLVLRTISPKIVEIEKENREPPNGEIEERTVMVDLEAQEELFVEWRNENIDQHCWVVEE